MNYSKDLIETWVINHKVTLYLLEHIASEWLTYRLGEKSRSIGEQFVHINNIRSMWINKVGEKVDVKIDKKQANNKTALKTALLFSAEHMVNTLERLFQENTIKGYKPHPAAFLGQMIAHEAHHRGQIMATVTRNKFPISKSVNFGLWGWSSRLKDKII